MNIVAQIRSAISHLNHAKGVYIINSKGIAYHQLKVLYIIKPHIRYTLARDEIQGRRAALDDIHDCVVMIYQACGLDKQKRNFCLQKFLFCWHPQRESNP